MRKAAREDSVGGFAVLLEGVSGSPLQSLAGGDEVVGGHWRWKMRCGFDTVKGAPG